MATATTVTAFLDFSTHPVNVITVNGGGQVLKYNVVAINQTQPVSPEHGPGRR